MIFFPTKICFQMLTEVVVYSFYMHGNQLQWDGDGGGDLVQKWV